MTDLVAGLLRVRERLATPERWCKGVSGASLNSRCLTMTVGLALNGDDYVGREKVRMVLRAVLGRPWLSIVQFNDAPETTHADVLALIDRAIERARVAAEVARAVAQINAGDFDELEDDEEG